jgi:hypothetical protein
VRSQPVIMMAAPRAYGLLTWRRRAKRRGLVSLRDVTPMDPQELTRVR